MTNIPRLSIPTCGLLPRTLPWSSSMQDQSSSIPHTHDSDVLGMYHLCISGCDSLETIHHVFVSCPAYRSFRQQATKTLITETSRILDSAEVPLLFCSSFLQVIRRLFEDGPDWPQSLSRFYLGLTPLLPCRTGLPEVKATRLLACIAHIWHTSSIRLAGRIWAEYKRRVRPAPPKKNKNAVAIELPSFLSPILSS
ncbi:hypothetical protein IW261DRAFT_1494167 [Armillaria novae-zelandiae]|uniref:Uncharacterized protein n=1 Tax=Armillaria novae-zelandiae TaxID=153914 RepID=A0AA39P1V3_9AGAR|nr:hypothetical protein IW261DRAFT_1494167 [Armillaria novae-zelandiae]